MAELLLGEPVFPGESAVDQLVEIIKILGTPTYEQVKLMNPNYNEFRFPQIKAHHWTKVKNYNNKIKITILLRFLSQKLILLLLIS